MEKKVHVAAAVVVREDGKILCAKRGNAKNPCVAWKWEFPGGKVEADESPQNALARELLEEMELRVRVGEKITTVVHAYPSLTIEMDAFFCVPDEKSATFTLREHVDARWLAVHELASMDWAPADLPVVEKLSALPQASLLF